jgi:hypothetical protein
MRFSALPGVLQNDTAPLIIDHRPVLDFLQGSKAAETDIVIVQAAISYARGLGGGVDVTHLGRHTWRRFEFDHTGEGESWQSITRTRIMSNESLLGLRCRCPPRRP